MKHTKRWVSLLLAVMMTVAAPLSAFAAWEDGFVIPGQNSGSNSYDDLFCVFWRILVQKINSYCKK